MMCTMILISAELSAVRPVRRNCFTRGEYLVWMEGRSYTVGLKILSWSVIRQLFFWTVWSKHIIILMPISTPILWYKQHRRNKKEKSQPWNTKKTPCM